MTTIETEKVLLDRTCPRGPIEELPAMLLAVAYGLTTRGRDRHDTSPNVVGAPDLGLLPEHQAAVGERLALESIIDCLDAAKAFLSVDGIPVSQLTETERRKVEFWRYRISIEARKLADAGLVDDRPRTLTEDGSLPLLGPSGLPERFAFTWRGIEKARETIPGTRWAHGPVTLAEGDKDSAAIKAVHRA